MDGDDTQAMHIPLTANRKGQKTARAVCGRDVAANMAPNVLGDCERQARVPALREMTLRRFATWTVVQGFDRGCNDCRAIMTDAPIFG
mgnify:FL=1